MIPAFDSVEHQDIMVSNSINCDKEPWNEDFEGGYTSLPVLNQRDCEVHGWESKRQTNPAALRLFRSPLETWCPQRLGLREQTFRLLIAHQLNQVVSRLQSCAYVALSPIEYHKPVIIAFWTCVSASCQKWIPTELPFLGEFAATSVFDWLSAAPSDYAYLALTW